MCFHALKDQTDKLYERMQKGRKKTFYKTVTDNRISPIAGKFDMPNNYKSLYYEKGKVVKAHRKRKRITKSSHMTSGIYVYSSKPIPRSDNESIIKVTAEAEDLIGAAGRLACFTQVTVVS